MAKAIISKLIQRKVAELIDAFNQKTFKGSEDFMYIPKFKGNFLYLNRKEFDRIASVARLEYSGDIKKWNFAIFKWITSSYDADEWLFPGTEYVDGAIEGAMKAWLAAYPV